jgi:transposase-like protein
MEVRGGWEEVWGEVEVHVTLEFPALEEEVVVERECIFCGGLKVYRHGKRKRATRDVWVKEVEGRRMRCLGCGRTFTVWPEGQTVGRWRTDRAILCGVILYSYGMSYPKVVTFMGGLGVKESVGTVYEDVIRSAWKARRRNRTGVKEVRILGVDGTGQKVKGQGTVGVMMGVDWEKGFLLDIELAEEADPEEVKNFLKRLLRGHKGVKVIVTDEHRNYEGIAGLKGDELRHYRCRAHWVRAKLRRLWELRKEMERKGWRKRLEELDVLEGLIRAGPQGQPATLERLKELYHRYLVYKPPASGKKYGLGYRLRLLVQEFLEKFEEIGHYTNNVTERLIGLALKFRSRGMRGFKRKENVSLMAHLLFWLWFNRNYCQLSLLA